jgi:hypothetical protein
VNLKKPIISLISIQTSRTKAKRIRLTWVGTATMAHWSLNRFFYRKLKHSIVNTIYFPDANQPCRPMDLSHPHKGPWQCVWRDHCLSLVFFTD